MAGQILVMMVAVFAINLLPAFGPPTWIILVWFRLRHDIPIVPLVVLGAVAAGSGRLVLAIAFRHLGGRLPAGKRADLEALGGRLTERSAASWGGLALFAVSPLPSAQLFEAAGLTPSVPLVPLTCAFTAGRLVSYSIAVSGASLAEGAISGLLDDGLRSPWAIALQVLMLTLLAAFVLIPWSRILGHRRGPPRL